MPTYFIRSCGHSEVRNPSLWTNGPDESLGGQCCDCRTKRIGSAPKRSRNHRDGITEARTSVYEIRDSKAVLVGWHFDFHSRLAFMGTGRIVGWGSDEEPLVEIISIRKISCKQAEELLNA